MKPVVFVIKLPLTLTGLLSLQAHHRFVREIKKDEREDEIQNKKLNQLQREFRISNEFSLFRIASAYSVI